MNGIPWTKKEDKYIRNHYPNGDTKKIAEKLNKTYYAVLNRAHYLGVKKTKKFKQKQGLRIKEKGEIYRFKKGQTPPNKGKKQTEYMSAESIEKTKSTRFKKGQTPHNALKDWQEVQRKDSSGIPYIMIKVPGQRVLKYKHRWLWEKENGNIPKKHIICFKDGNTLNCVIENLECISMGENIRRNSYNRVKEWNKEQAKRAIQNQIRKNKEL
ncbi:MAG: HNH endonuclease [Flavobacteriales bacterium]|nr:MAG: HNH endonuclease [Flavobacteriales bacterium]